MNEELKIKMSEAFQGTASRLAATDPEWVEIVSNFFQDEAVSASKLTEKERMLCILSTLLGCQGMGEFRHMVHAALNGGLEPEAIREVIYQATAYLGIGRVYDFLETAGQIMEQARHPVSPWKIREPQVRRTALKKGWPNRWNCSGKAWQNGRRKGPSCAGTSTGGWRPTASAITIPEKVSTTRSGK
ncbi:MAG: carboxymuconolactone decarboxylase family protein [Lachnospiraceae bacterium]